MYKDTTWSHIFVFHIIVSIVTMTTGTPTSTSQSCGQCTSTSGASWAGGVLVGVVSGVLVMIIVWVIVTVISKKKSMIDTKRNIGRFSMTIIVKLLSFIFLDHMTTGTN